MPLTKNKYMKSKKFYNDLYKSRFGEDLPADEFDDFAIFMDSIIKEEELRKENTDVYGYKHARNIDAELSEKPTEKAEKALGLKNGFITRTYIFPKFFTDKYEFTDQIYVEDNEEKFKELFKETMDMNNISVFDDVACVNEMSHILNGMTSRYMLCDIEFWIKNKVRKKTKAFARALEYSKNHDLGFIPSVKTKNKINNAINKK